MKKIILAVLMLLGASGVNAASAKKWSEEIARTVMTRYPSALSIPFKAWCYPQGYFLVGLDKLLRISGDGKYNDYILSWANQAVDREGNPVFFRGNSMDDMMAGTVLVTAYRLTGDERFRKAAETIRRSFDDYPRTSDGIFWHGRRTVGQIWVDGVFMGQMFLTNYGKYIGDSDYCFDEAARQLTGMYRHLAKGDSGLLLHGWDEDKDARWADPRPVMLPKCGARAWVGMPLSLSRHWRYFPRIIRNMGSL